MEQAIVAIRQADRAALFVSLREPLVVGRDCDGLLLADSQVSRRHLQLEASGGRVIATDLGSTNGSFLNEERIESPVFLGAGDLVRLGSTQVELVSMSGGTSTSHAPTARGAKTETQSSPSGSRRTRPNPRATSIEVVLASVEEDAELAPIPDLETDKGTVTIVFSDIVSSSEQALALGDEKWLEVLEHHNRVITEAVDRYGGRIIKSQGDGYMISFPGARRAILAMAAAQQAFAEMQRTNSDHAVSVRIGLHTGEAIAQDGDFLGRLVITAARIGGLATAGEILVSSLVREITAPRRDIAFGPGREVALKGVEGKHMVYAVKWTELGP